MSQAAALIMRRSLRDKGRDPFYQRTKWADERTVRRSPNANEINSQFRCFAYLSDDAVFAAVLQDAEAQWPGSTERYPGEAIYDFKAYVHPGDMSGVGEPRAIHFLSHKDAVAFATKHGLEIEQNVYYWSAARRAELQRYRDSQ